MFQHRQRQLTALSNTNCGELNKRLTTPQYQQEAIGLTNLLHTTTNVKL